MRKILLILGLLLAAPAAASAAEISRELKPFTADAAAGLVAWASYDEATNAYRLATWTAAGGRRVGPMPPGDIHPYQLDVGTDTDGGPVVTYARCADAATARGCDLYAYDPASQQEHRLPDPVNTDADETAPSVHRGRLAFARGRRLYTVALAGGTPRRRDLPRGVIGITATELSARGLFVRALTPSEFQTLRLYRLWRGRATQLDRATSGGANAAGITKPSVAGGRVYYARTNNGSGTGNRIHRIDLRTGRRQEAQGNPRIQSAARLGAEMLIAESSYGPGLCGGMDLTGGNSQCRLYTSGPLEFTPTAPGRRD